MQAAIAAGTLAARRLENYDKLMREQALNAATLAQRRAADKSQGKFIKKGLEQSVRNKRGL